MILQNLHTHTSFSDGKNTAEKMALSAIACGCTSLGYSEHSPFAWENSSWAMEKTTLKEYRSEILRLREKYAGKLDVFLGMEQDLDSPLTPERWDYLIGSVHYVLSGDIYRSVDLSASYTEKTIQEFFVGDPYAYVESYFRRVATVAEKTGCQIVGHFDLVAKFNEGGKMFDENHPRYLTAALDALDELAKHDVIFEINTGAMSRGYRTSPYPSSALLKAMRDRNCRICVTSDTHSADTILHAFDQARELAKSHGFREGWVLTKQGFIPQEI